MVTVIIRLILTAVLIYLAYGETGAWTALCLFLIMTSNELAAINRSE